MNLIIVESPTKAKTIQKFLKENFIVRSTFGHVRDLPKSKLGIDINGNFKPKYVVPQKARKRISELKKYLPQAEKIILATDEDREGEAIAWHIIQILDLDHLKSEVSGEKPYQRIVFHEITSQAIKEALQNPRLIDINLVNAQQARRILDRLVGYNLSPLLWRKIKRGLSAGRVQSVALRLICEREKEIREFKPKEYRTIEGVFQAIQGDKNRELTAELYKKNDKIIDKFEIKSKEGAEEITQILEKLKYQISKIEITERLQNPLPPLTTSLLQQDAWRKYHFPAKFTMKIAQGLYERGFITYHRTDSFNLSNQSLFRAKEFIEEKFGKEYWAGYFRKYKTKSKSAQEAHEAIRPTDPFKDPPSGALAKEDKTAFANAAAVKLYDLIWRRFIASQMATARIEEKKIKIKSYNKIKDEYEFLAQGKIIKFEGFLKIYPLYLKEKKVPEFSQNESLNLLKLLPLQHWTLPPRRYNEGSLVKTLEQYGIGRPSTYAPTISTIQKRGYVAKDRQRYFRPTEIGEIVNNLLVIHFPDIVDINFTAKMEDNLDKIANVKINWQKVLQDFYFPFEKNLKKKEKEIEKETGQETKENCPKCGARLVIRWSRYGKFLACSAFPKCGFTKPYKNQELE